MAEAGEPWPCILNLPDRAGPLASNCVRERQKVPDRQRVRFWVWILQKTGHVGSWRSRVLFTALYRPVMGIRSLLD